MTPSRWSRSPVPGYFRISAGEYLAWRRAMGYQLSRHDELIGQFLDHLEHQHVTRISAVDTLAWACLPRGARPRWHSATSDRDLALMDGGLPLDEGEGGQYRHQHQHRHRGDSGTALT